MRRLCICALMVPSLLIAAAPAHASQTKSYRHQAASGAARTHATPSPRATRSRTTRGQKLTWGRT